MRSQFPLFQSHLDLAKSYWSKFLQKGDIVIDATCGNGRDSLSIAEMILPEGTLYAIDIQEEAISKTQQLLVEKIDPLSFSKIHFICQSHVHFPEAIQRSSVKGVIYNLGYLPKGDKTLTTQTEHTLESLKKALPLICLGGFLSITCYPGHGEGKKEEQAIQEYCRLLNPKQWNVCYHQFVNRVDSPSLFFLQNSG